MKKHTKHVLTKGVWYCEYEGITKIYDSGFYNECE